MEKKKTCLNARILFQKKEDPRPDAKKSVVCRYPLSLSPPYPDTTEGSANGKQKRVCTFVLNIETSSQKSPPYTGIHIQYWHISRRSVHRRGPWRHAARPRPRPLSNIRTLREMAIHGMPKVISLSLSSYGSTLSGLHKRQDAYIPPSFPPLK